MRREIKVVCAEQTLSRVGAVVTVKIIQDVAELTLNDGQTIVTPADAEHCCLKRNYFCKENEEVRETFHSAEYGDLRGNKSEAIKSCCEDTSFCCEDTPFCREEKLFYCEKKKFKREEMVRFGAIRFRLSAIRFRFGAIKNFLCAIIFGECVRLGANS